MDDHLSQIDTLWSVIRRAHNADTNAESAQRELLERYSGAIQRYLAAKLRDPAAADDVYQDFALKFVRGDFKNATPEKGRFRTFIRTVLFRMVADHFRGKKRDKAVDFDEQLIEPVGPDEEAARDEEFIEVWRDEMLKNAWDGLWELEKSSGKRWFTVLQLRVKNPELRSADLAASLSEELDKPISTSNVRVLLHRAREKFSTLLIDTVAESLNSRSYADVEEELADLRLLEFCQASLEQLKAEQNDEDQQ